MRQGLILLANGILSINASTFRVALLDGLYKVHGVDRKQKTQKIGKEGKTKNGQCIMSYE